MIRAVLASLRLSPPAGAVAPMRALARHRAYAFRYRGAPVFSGSALSLKVRSRPPGHRNRSHDDSSEHAPEGARRSMSSTAINPRDLFTQSPASPQQLVNA